MPAHVTHAAYGAAGVLFLLMNLLGGCAGQEEELTPAERRRLMSDPRAAEHLIQAQEAFEREAYTIALAFVDSAVVHAPELPDVYFLRGRIFTELQREDLARTAYEQVIALDATYPGVHLNLGHIAARRGAAAEALALYRKELANHPSANLWVSIGRAYEEQRQPDSARYAYEQALAADSSLATAYMRLGQVYKETGRLHEAVAVSRKGLALQPENLNYKYALGSLLLLVDEAEEAVQQLRPVVEARPWHYWAHYNLGRALVRLGRQEEADPYLEQAKRLQAHLSEIDYWQGLAQNNPDQFMLWVKLADALRRSGREAEAQEADRMALSLAPHYMVREVAGPEADAVNRRAGIELLNGNAAGAIAHYRALLSQEPRHPDLWLNLGLVYAASGHLEEAHRAWETALRYTPNHAGAKMYLVQLAQTYTPPDS